MIAWSPEKLSQMVREHLLAHRDEFGDERIDIADVQATQDDDYWQVVVVFNPLATKGVGVFHDVLNRIEDELEQQHNVQVMIIPCENA